MKQRILDYLEKLLKEADRYYPDNDSMRDGYREAVMDIINDISGMGE